MARNIWPLVQNRNEEEWALAHSDEWRFPLGRVDFCNSAESVCVSVCPRTFVNSSGTEGRIRTRQTPKDAPKRRNDDGVCHVAPRATWHVPRAAAWTLSKTILAGQSGRKKGRRDTKLSGYVHPGGIHVPCKWRLNRVKIVPSGHDFVFQPYAL